MSRTQTSQTALQDDTMEKLKELTGKIGSAGDSALEERFARIEEDIKRTENIRDDQKRDKALAVIKATLDTLLEDAKREELDLADAVNNLDTLIEQIGGDFEKLANLNEEELAIVDKAQADLDRVKGAWLVFKRAEKIKTYEDLLQEARLEAARQMRKRLMNMSFEQSTQVLQKRTGEAISIMMTRREKIAEQVKILTNRKKIAFDILQQAATTVQDLINKANRVDEQLRAAEQDLAQIENGTPDYAKQQEKVSKLREQSTQVNGEVNVAKDIHQSKERFALQLEVHEISQIKQRDNLSIWISGLKSDMEERVVTIRSRIEAAKAMSDQEIASSMDKLGAKLDQTTTEYMAKVGRVSDHLRLQRAEAQPQRMRDLDAVRRGQAEAHKETLTREDKIFEEFKGKYGIDPAAGWFSRPHAEDQRVA